MRSQLVSGVLLTRSRRFRIRMPRTHRRNVWVCGPRVCQKGESTSQRRYSGGVVFQHVLVPLKQARSFRAAGSALGHLPDAWRFYALPDKKPVRVQQSYPLLFVLVSPVLCFWWSCTQFARCRPRNLKKPLWEGGRCFSDALHTSKAIEMGRSENCISISYMFCCFSLFYFSLVFLV